MPNMQKVTKMSTIIGIFEYPIINLKKLYQLLNQEVKLEDLHIFMIQLKFAILAWKKNLCRHYSISCQEKLFN